MNTNDKTLADVQPGGRVRLGDQRSDLVPGIVRCAKCQFQLARSNLNMHSGTVTAGDSKTEPCPNGCGPLWPVTWETWAREGWAEAERLHLENAALSAQPSPGGQDALLESLVARWRNHAEEIGVSDNLLCQKIANCTMRHAVELQAVLAARQPSTQPDSVALGEETEFCIEKGDRQPVGEPLAWLIERLRGKGYGRDKYVVMKGQASSDPDSHLFWTDQQARDNHRVTPLYKWPAQSVDLSGVREAVRKAWQKCAAGESVDLQFGTLLALIDSQAGGIRG